VTKKEIIDIVSKNTKQPRNHVKIVVEAILDVFIEQISKEGRIELRDFGVFKVRKTPARIGRNPMTKVEAEVPSRNIIQFKAGKLMKNLVNNS